VEAVAGLVGYHDVSSFYRVFKNEFGMAPGEYRNHYQ
jgi:AraC-like DNA-binding protein